MGLSYMEEIWEKNERFKIHFTAVFNLNPIPKHHIQYLGDISQKISVSICVKASQKMHE